MQCLLKLQKVKSFKYLFRTISLPTLWNNEPTSAVSTLINIVTFVTKQKWVYKTKKNVCFIVSFRFTLFRNEHIFKMCILHHWGVQLILAYSWARPAILVVGKGRGGMFLFLLFLHFHSCSSFFPVPLFHLLYSLSSISFLPFSGRRHKMTLKGWRVVKPQHNQSINWSVTSCFRVFPIYLNRFICYETEMGL